MSVFINRDKCFAFVELTSIELTTACCKLDGLSYCGNQLRIRRPNDFQPDKLPSNLGKTPNLNLSALGVVSTTVADGPNKVFVGGLPNDLNESDIKDLLMAFGNLKSFHLVKEPGLATSKGYAFCEYADATSTNTAIMGLNNFPIRDRVLTVKLASQNITPTLPSTPGGHAALAGIYGPGSYGIGNPNNTNNSNNNNNTVNGLNLITDFSNQTPTRVCFY